MKSMLSSTSKKNVDLTQDKLVMQKQLDVLNSQEENLNEQLRIVTNEKHDLYAQINIHEKKNILQKEKFNEYIQLEEKKISEVKDIVNYLYEDVILFKQKFVNLNKSLKKSKVDINALACN